MFKGVEDERRLEVKLDNILINGKKIHANIPRFTSGGPSSFGGGFGVRTKTKVAENVVEKRKT